MQGEDLPQRNEIERFKNSELSEFLNSKYCPDNFKKFCETAHRNAQIDNFIGVDVVAAGLVSNFLFWFSKWICANLPKVVVLLYEAKKDVISEGTQRKDLTEVMEDVRKRYEKLKEKIRNLGNLKLDECGITSDLPENFTKYILQYPDLSQIEKDFIVFWGKMREYALTDLGIYMIDWPQFVKYEVFKSKLIEFSHPAAREDIERSLEASDEDELKHILAPFYHPREGTFILYDTEEALKRQDMKDVFSPSVETLLSYAIHESIGHGFFYRHTQAGSELASSKAVQLLMSERVEPPVDIKRSKKVKELGLLWEQTQTLRESFAIWVQLRLLQKMNAVHPDLSLDEEIERVSQLVSEGAVMTSNPYSVGFHVFKKIEKHYGELCVPRALQIACNMTSPGDFKQRLANISETHEKVVEDMRFPALRKNDLNWFDHAVNHIWNYRLPRIRFAPVIRFSYVEG